LGAATPDGELHEKIKGSAMLTEAHGRMVEHLHANNCNLGQTPLTLGVPLLVDPSAERFKGPDAARANAMLTREYRAPFTVPSIA
jgi:hypothetical protein